MHLSFNGIPIPEPYHTIVFLLIVQWLALGMSRQACWVWSFAVHLLHQWASRPIILRFEVKEK